MSKPTKKAKLSNDEAIRAGDLASRVLERNSDEGPQVKSKSLLCKCLDILNDA